MTNPGFTFDDELLCTVLDGTADAETIASVDADLAASDRLESLRRVQHIVAAPPPAGPADRRTQSIASALAAARPVEGVTSLATVRQSKISRLLSARPQVSMRWVAAAAAALTLGIGIPAAISTLNTGGDTDTATAGDSTASLANDADAAAEAAVEPIERSAADDNDAAIAQNAPAADGESDGFAATNSNQFDGIVAYPDVDQLLAEIENDGLEPRFVGDDPVILDAVSPRCLEQFADIDGVAFGLIVIAPGDADETMVLVYFAEDGSVEVLNAEDCSLIG